jgi:hypothetical protein
MQEIDVLMDDHPDLAFEMVQNDIQNRKAHKELESFNNTGKFLYIHPFTVKNQSYTSQYEELLKLKRENPTGFLNEITNVTQNIRRIESNLRQKKFKNDTTKQNWEDNLTRAKERQGIITTLLKE